MSLGCHCYVASFAPTSPPFAPCPQLRFNKVSELIHNSTHHRNLPQAKVTVHFQEIIDKVRQRRAAGIQQAQLINIADAK